jgi:hypothetical protein
LRQILRNFRISRSKIKREKKKKKVTYFPHYISFITTYSDLYHFKPASSVYLMEADYIQGKQDAPVEYIQGEVCIKFTLEARELIEGQVSFIPPPAEASIFLVEGKRKKIRKKVTTKTL